MSHPQPSSDRATPPRQSVGFETRAPRVVERRPESSQRPHRWIALDMLDRQIVDRDQQPVGKVDDVYFDDLPATELPGPGAPHLSSLLSGAEAFGQRMGGLLGRLTAGAARRMLPEGRDGARAVPWRDVARLDYVIVLRAGIGELNLEPALELWFRANVIAPIPGSGRARG